MVLVAAMAIQNAVHRVHLASAPPSTLMTGTTTQVMLDIADVIYPGDGAQAQTGRLFQMSINVVVFALGCAAAALLYAHFGVRCFFVPPVVAVVALIIRLVEPKQVSRCGETPGTHKGAGVLSSAATRIRQAARSKGFEMITIPELVAQALGSFLTSDTRSRFGASHARLAEVVPFAARLTLDCIGNSDALYHNIEHSMLVTLAGHDILMGRQMSRATTAEDYANFILACLTHDIGYVRGILQGDDNESYVADLSGRTIQLPRGSSDAALAPYHVDRSKLFVSERLDGTEEVDAGRIARAIEYTRFPYTSSSNNDDDLIEEEGLLLRAADLIGQLGDPNYLRKSNALFYEFEEIGLNKKLGYDTPADVVYKYPQFYWNNVAPQIQTAIRYLNVTSSGRQWIANLYANVFRAERELNLSGPQL